MKNIALLYPEVFEISRYGRKRKEFPPFGILYLASVAEHSGFNVTIKKITRKEYSFNLKEFSLVGFSAPSSFTYPLVRNSITSSSYNNNKLLLIGGLHASLYPQETLKETQPDVLVVGYGEFALAKILNNFRSRKFSEINNIYYLKDGVYKHNKENGSHLDITQLPHPARHLLPEDDFIMTNRLSNTNYRMAHVMFTRGCSFNCNFCASGRRKTEFRDAVSIRNELILLKEKYQIQGFAIVDDNAIINKEKTISYCEAIKDLGLKWSALSRIDTVDDEILKIMESSRCIEIKFGIESGSQNILNRMNKKITINQIKRTIKQTKNFGIKVKAFIIHGFPGENMETTQETIKLLSEIKHFIDRITVFRFVPLPGSPVYEKRKDFDIHGTHYEENWDGNWSKFRIYHNDTHWWGGAKDYIEVKKSYKVLNKYVTSNFPDEI